MLRCTIELLPAGDETRARTIGLVEIANVGGTDAVGNYVVVLKKVPPMIGALKSAWRKGRFQGAGEDADIIAGRVEGHHRTRRGAYDLLFRALKACGLDARNPR